MPRDRRFFFSFCSFLIFFFFAFVITNLAVKEQDWENGLVAEAKKTEDADAMNEIIRMDERRDIKTCCKYCWYHISKWEKSTLAMIEGG